MDKTININGVDYIRRDSIRNDVDFKELKKVVEKSLKDMNQVNLILDSYLDDVSQEKEVKKAEVKHKSKFKIWNSSQKLYHNVDIDKNGIIKTGTKRSKLHINDIMSIQKDMQNMDMKEIMSKYDNKFTRNHIHRIVYNIENNVFDNVIKKFKNKKNDDEEYKVSGFYQRSFAIASFDVENGIFVFGNGTTSQFTIHDVIDIKNKVINKKITKSRAKIIASGYDFNFGIFERIVFSLKKGVFDSYIEEWKRRINNIGTPVKKEPVVQNNPEKRIESGFGGVIPSS